MRVYIGWDAIMRIRKIFVLIIATMVAVTTPLVLAASEDSVIITFDPDGDIDIDISLASYNFSSVQANDWSNSTGGTFTLETQIILNKEKIGLV